MTMNRLARIAVCLAAPLAIAPLTMAYAQETTGSISGTVTDSSGAAIKGATVVLTNTDRNHVERTLKTDSKGFYTATSLPLGTYSVRMTETGFKSELETTLVLHVNDALTVSKALVAGDSSETITVTADALQVNLEDATSAGLINGTQVRELVLNNRNYEQLLNLQPGVSYGGATDQLYIGTSLPAGTAAVVSFSVNGQRNSSNNWTIDGADNVDRGSNLTLLAYPSIDAIAEFKTLRGTYSAAFGRSASSQINVVTRSGTNDIHGSAYEFFRNNVFNANNYFNKLTAVPTARPLLRYNDFGFTFGGPVVIPKVYNGKDKTFFFYSQEFRRVINYTTVTVYVPTAQEKAGDFTGAGSYSSTNAAGPVAVCTAATAGTCTAYGTKITNFSPTALAYVNDIFNKIPAPNVAASAGLDPHAYIYNQRSVYNNAQEFARIDQAIGSKMNVFYRYLHDSLPTIEGGGIYVGGGLPGVNVTSTTAPATTHLGHMTYTFTPTFLFDAGYAYSAGAILSNPTGLAASANSPDIKPNLPAANVLGNVPNLSFTSLLANITSAGQYRDYNHNHNVFASATKVVGNHTFQAGVSYDHYQKTENALGNGSPYPQGTFGFTTATPTLAQATAAGGALPSSFDSVFANLLIGNVNNSFTQASVDLTPNLQVQQWEGYIQDTWKALPRLSLSLGVRYSYFPQPHDTNNILSNFDPDTYVAANAPTIDSSGFICKTGTTCANTQGLNSGAPNTNYDPLNGIILGTPGAYGHPSPFGNEVGHTDTKNFAPRVGFAIDVFGDGKTAFRGGYGIAYDATLFGIYEQNEFGNPPYTTTYTATGTNLDNPSPAAAAAAPTPSLLVASPINYHTPYTQQYSLDVQQQLSGSFLLDIAYVGNHSTHLLGQIDINELHPGQAAATGQFNAIINGTGFTSSTVERPLNQLRPYKGYNAINAVESIFSSNYNSLQVAVKKQFSGKSYIAANYTFSRALTNNQSDRSTAPQNTYNIAAEYGRSALDRTNILTINGVWELPWYRDQKGLLGHIVGGWQISGIYAANSGLPLTATMSAALTLPDGSKTTDAAGLGILGSSAASLRPNMVSNPNVGVGQQLKTRLNWFNKLAFSAPTAASGAVGNEKRGVINGPGYNRLDTGLFRNFRIYDNVVFQLRGEAFNTFNHTNWATVGTAASTLSTFGTVTATRDPRILQVAGKLTF